MATTNFPSRTIWLIAFVLVMLPFAMIFVMRGGSDFGLGLGLAELGIGIFLLLSAAFELIARNDRYNPGRYFFAGLGLIILSMGHDALRPTWFPWAASNFGWVFFLIQIGFTARQRNASATPLADDSAPKTRG